MNTDARGLKRGKCENCDCDEYWYEAEKGHQCSFCQCPPTKHAKLESEDYRTMSQMIMNHGDDVSENVVYEIVQSASCSSLSTSTNTSTQSFPEISTVLELESLLPARLPKVVELALTKKKLMPTQRCQIVRSIADRCYSSNVPTHVVDLVADMAVKRWSPLKSPDSNKSKALAIQIKRRVAKLRASGKKCMENATVVEQTDNSNEHGNCLTAMAVEMMGNNPSVAKLKNLLNNVREKRRELTDKMTAAEHIKLYPALKKQELLLWEFCSITDTSVTMLQGNWKGCSEALESYFKDTRYEIPECYSSSDMKAVYILKVLPNVLQSGKRTKCDRKFLVQFFEETTPLMETVPPSSDPPRLIAVGTSEKADLCLSCYVDGMPLFTTTGEMSIVLLLATYWVFNTEFPPEARPSYLFLAKVFLREKFSSQQLCKSSSVQGLLAQLKL